MTSRDSRKQTHPISRQVQARPAFLLLLVMVVIAIASLAMLNFSRSMLVSNESAKISSGRLQARMAAESGAQAARLFLAYPAAQRAEMGGTWSNANFFQARNVMPSQVAQLRGNYSIVSPALDQTGAYSGIRFGLQNESCKLNLNALVQIDQLAQSGALASSATSGAGGAPGISAAGLGDAGAAGGALSGGGALAGGVSQLASQAASGMGASLATNMLLALPGVTPDIADSILDWLDEDDTPRPYGAEVDYYSTLQPPYKPANGQIESIEQLLLVRAVTPRLLYGYDENRNGYLDSGEAQKASQGIQPGSLPGAVNANSLDPNYIPPPPLGLAAYLTLHSQEKNLAFDGTQRVNINNPDLQTLYEDLKSVLGNEAWASFIVAYRVGGVAKPSPLISLASMAAEQEIGSEGGALGAQIQARSNAMNRGLSGGGRTGGRGGNTRGGQQSGGQQGGQNPGGGQGQPTGPVTPWTVDALSQVDLTQGGRVQFQQVLDLYDATLTIGQGQSARTYSSPFTSLPVDMALTSPVLLDKLTTTDSQAVPGRLNIMECPRELLLGIPGLSEEIVEEILTARVDGSQSETRRFETWLCVEGMLTLEQMRGLTPLLTCGGDVFKCQIVGYLEGDAAFSRVEAIINAAGDLPKIQFFRRLDHLGRGFGVATLGQRADAVLLGGP